MGWRSRLTYRQVVATGIRRSLTVLAAYGDVDAVTALLDSDPSRADDPEALREAAARGHDAIVRLILHHRPGVIDRVAVAARTRPLTEFLFQRGMDPNRAGWLGVTPLHRFAQQGEIDNAAIFLDHGANLHALDEEFCTTPLGYAALNGKLQMVEFLLQRGAKPALPDDLTWATPISLAQHRRHDEIVCLLSAYR
jgi:ankyrin repeat protein